eukprot:724635-Alexandrium_andersonii.AAC.1
MPIVPIHPISRSATWGRSRGFHAASLFVRTHGHVHVYVPLSLAQVSLQRWLVNTVVCHSCFGFICAVFTVFQSAW